MGFDRGIDVAPSVTGERPDPEEVLASGEEVAGLNVPARLGLAIGLFPVGRGEDGSVFPGTAIKGSFGRLEASYVTGANETFRGASKKGDLSPVVIATAGLNVVDLSLISTISTDGLGEASSGSGESLESVDSFLLPRLLRLGTNTLLTSGVVNSVVIKLVGERSATFWLITYLR